MKESTYFGNFKDIIDCDSLIERLKGQEGDKRTVENPYSNKTNFSDRLNEEKKRMRDIWVSAGYDNSDSVEWINYYPGTHFEKEIVDKFSEKVNADPYNIWISSMRPGKCVPWHWDIINDYELYENDPRMVRYSFFIDKPQIGKVFILNNEAYHGVEQGSVYKWNKWDEWHLGFNCGTDQKFLFHFIGFSR